MLSRLRFLNEAIGGLRGSGAVSCNDIEEYQWGILGEIEDGLFVPGEVQRELEDEKYITASLVPLSIHLIRNGYTDMIHNGDVTDVVRKLMENLLADFDKRYKPLNGKVQFKNEVTLGHGNRCVYVHVE